MSNELIDGRKNPNSRRADSLGDFFKVTRENKNKIEASFQEIDRAYAQIQKMTQENLEQESENKENSTLRSSPYGSSSRS